MKNALKRIAGFGLALLMLLGTAGAEWAVNKDGHWQAEGDVQSHVLEEGTCTVCGADVYFYEDGTADVYLCDDRGNWTLYIWYDADGTVVEHVNEITYDELGNMLCATEFVNGVLTAERFYKLENEWLYEYRLTEYVDEVTMTTEEFNVLGDVISSTTYEYGEEVYRDVYFYDESGTLISSESYTEGVLTEEYTYALYLEADGYSVGADSSTAYLPDGTTVFLRYDKRGDRMEETTFDAQGDVISRYTFLSDYDAEGNLLWEEKYEAGELIEKIEYLYDEAGWIVDELVYDGAGNLITE